MRDLLRRGMAAFRRLFSRCSHPGPDCPHVGDRCPRCDHVVTIDDVWDKANAP